MTIDDQIASAHKRITNWQQAAEGLESGEYSLGRNQVDVSDEWAATFRRYIAETEQLIDLLEDVKAGKR